MVSRSESALGILIVSNLFPPDIAGGAEIVAARQAEALANRGCRVEVFAGYRPETAACAGQLKSEIWRGLRVHRLALRSLGVDDNFQWSLAARYFDSILQRGAFDVVHFHNMAGLGAGLIELARVRGCKTVVTVHDHWGFCYRANILLEDNAICNSFDNCHLCQPSINFEGRSALPMRLRRDYVAMSLACADRFVFPSRYLAEAYVNAGFNRTRMRVVSNRIDTASFSKTKSPSDIVRFLSLTYLGEHKGVLVLLDALRRLSADKSLAGRWLFRLGGAGHLKDYIERAVDIAPLRGNVEFLGHVERSKIPVLYQETEVFVLASISPENEPVTLLECAATATAQLATRLGGNPGLVLDGVTGFLFEPGDAEALAVAMRRYILDPALARDHGRVNGERSFALDEQRTVDELLDLYSDIEPNQASDSMPIVVCVGAQPLEYVRLILNSWHETAPELNNTRFVSDVWWPAENFSAAAAIWFWDSKPPPALLLQAVRSGKPILAPRSDSKLDALRHLGVLAFRYDDGLEALSLLKALLSSGGWEAGHEVAVAADFLAEGAYRESFEMHLTQ